MPATLRYVLQGSLFVIQTMTAHIEDLLPQQQCCVIAALQGCDVVLCCTTRPCCATEQFAATLQYCAAVQCHCAA